MSMSISFNSDFLSCRQKYIGDGINQSTTNTLNYENNDENKKAYLKPFGGSNLGTGTQQTDASAIQACGNSLNFYS